MIKKYSLVLAIMFGLAQVTFAYSDVNNLRETFLSNKAIIMAINIRTFNAKDKDSNGLIDEGEERGNFLNAIERLDELKAQGINTLHVLPINPTGKLKALGTAGSVYAPISLLEINPLMADTKSQLSVNEQVKKFTEECHKRGIRVIVDLPSCGSYDMYLEQPDLFKKDKSQTPIVPTDWTDVRLFDTDSQNLYDTGVGI